MKEKIVLFSTELKAVCFRENERRRGLRLAYDLLNGNFERRSECIAISTDGLEIISSTHLSRLLWARVVYIFCRIAGILASAFFIIVVISVHTSVKLLASARLLRYKAMDFGI
jgi:hypothetical protein